MQLPPPRLTSPYVSLTLHFLPDFSLTLNSLVISAGLVPIARPPVAVHFSLWVVASVSASALFVSTWHSCDPDMLNFTFSPTWAMTHEDSLPSIVTPAKLMPSFGSNLSSILFVPPPVSSSLSSTVSIFFEASLQLAGVTSLHSSKVILAVDVPTVAAAPPSIVPVILPFSHLTSEVTIPIVPLRIDAPLFVPS